MRPATTRLDHATTLVMGALAVLVPPILVVTGRAPEGPQKAAREEVFDAALTIGLPALLAVAAALALSYGRRSLCAWLAVLGAGWFVVVLAAMHFVAPHVDPFEHPGSVYVLQEHGGWVVPIYFALTTMVLATSLAVRDATPSGFVRFVVSVFTGLAAGGFFLAGVFPMDPPEVQSFSDLSHSGALHMFGAMETFPSMGLLPPLMYAGARRHIRDSGMSRMLLLGAILALPLLALVFFLAPHGYLGLGQRAFMALVCVWFPGVAFAVRR